MKEKFKANPILLPAFLFFTAFLMSFIVLSYENVNRIDYWKNFDVSNTNDMVLKKCHYNAINSSAIELETMIVVKNSMQVLTLSNNNIECFKDWEYYNNSVKISWTKMFLLISEFLVLIAYFISLFVLFSTGYRKFILHLTHKNEEHIVIIGLSEISKTLIESLLKNKNKNKIIVLEKDKNNFYIDEVRKQGAIVIIGDASQELFLNDAKVYTSKEIYMMCKDIINLEITSTIFNKLNEVKSVKRENPLNIYIHLQRRSNRELFDQNGLFKLKYDSLNFYPFSFDEIIAKRIFVKRPLTLTINDPWDENEVQRILIVNFNNMAEEILYQVLKIGHFVNAKPIEIVVADDDYKILEVKYQNWINIGDNPYQVETEKDKKSIWKLSFMSIEKLYEIDRVCSELFFESSFKFNRIVFCNKISGKSIEWLNLINKSFINDMKAKKTIIQLYNANVKFGDLIDKNTSKFNLFYTFGEVTSIADSSIIKESNLYRVARISNNYKELTIGHNITKAWETLDLFTRESNITEKEHMDIKLDALGISLDDLNQIYNINDYNIEDNNIDSPTNQDLIDLKDKNSSCPYIKELITFLNDESNKPISTCKQTFFELLIKTHKSVSKDKNIRNKDNLKNIIYGMYYELYPSSIINKDNKQKFSYSNIKESLKKLPIEARKNLKKQELIINKKSLGVEKKNKDLLEFANSLVKDNNVDKLKKLDEEVPNIVPTREDRIKNNLLLSVNNLLEDELKKSPKEAHNSLESIVKEIKAKFFGKQEIENYENLVTLLEKTIQNIYKIKKLKKDLSLFRNSFVEYDDLANLISKFKGNELKKLPIKARETLETIEEKINRKTFKEKEIKKNLLEFEKYYFINDDLQYLTFDPNLFQAFLNNLAEKAIERLNENIEIDNCLTIDPLYLFFKEDDITCSDKKLARFLSNLSKETRNSFITLIEEKNNKGQKLMEKKENFLNCIDSFLGDKSLSELIQLDDLHENFQVFKEKVDARNSNIKENKKNLSEIVNIVFKSYDSNLEKIEEKHLPKEEKEKYLLAFANSFFRTEDSNKLILKFNDEAKTYLEIFSNLETMAAKSYMTEEENDLLDIADSFFAIDHLSLVKRDSIESLAKLEHTRWNAFHLLNGWKRKTEEIDKDHKDLELKLHYDLCDWETLRVDHSDVIKYDYKNIYHIPYILKKMREVDMKELRGVYMKNTIIGITGNRNLTGTDTDKLKEEIKTTFSEIIKLNLKKKNKITLFSPLADGADRLVVEVALDNFPDDINIKVPIPFDVETYKGTFGSEQENIKNKSIKEFDSLINRIEKQYCNPIIEMEFDRKSYDNSDTEKQKEKRHIQYSIVGEYVASNSDYLMAIYNDYKEGKKGGTKEILKKAEENEYTHFNTNKKISTIYKMIIKDGEITRVVKELRNKSSNNLSCCNKEI